MLPTTNDTRYDIVFLRCLAIVAVVCFHFDLGIFRDGYAGVDIFFVLSGYLMTQIITRQVKSGTFSFLAFYARRLARILPALLFLIVVFLLLIYFLLGIKLYDFCRFALSSVLFLSNIHYYQASGYFAASSQLNFLLHTWSLSVEAQFYLIYPLILLGIGKNRKKQFNETMPMLSVLLLLSFGLMCYAMQTDRSFSFYMVPTRLWEFLMGGLTFVYRPAWVSRIAISLRKVLGFVAIFFLVLALSGFLEIGYRGWPSASTFIPVGLTALLLLLSPDFRFYRSFLVVYIARISYSWYLWHWPMLVFCTYFAWNQHSTRVSVFLLSIVVSGVAYLLVERRQYFWKPRLLILGLFLTACVTFSLTRISPNKILLTDVESRLTPFLRSYSVQCAPEQYDFGRGHLLANAPFDKFDRRQLFEFSDSLKNYLLLGDCHAGMFSATLRNLAKKNNVHLMQATADETFPVPGIRSVFQGPTQLMNYMYGSYLPDNLQKIDKVILAANYVSYGKKELSNYINQVDSFFSAYHVPIIVIGQTEGYCIEYPVVEVLHRRFGIHRSDYLLPARYHANQFLKCSKISERYIDVYNLPAIMHGDGYQAYLYDADHMSTFGTNQYEDLLQDRIFGGNPKP